MIASRVPIFLLAACAGMVSQSIPRADHEDPRRISQRHEFTQIHMGLPVRLVLYADARAAREAAEAAFARIATLDRMMSDYRPDSELRLLETRYGAPTVVSRELFAVLQRAVEIAGASNGAFDPTVGPLVSLWRDARKSARLPPAAALRVAKSSVGWRHLELDPIRTSIRFAVPGMRLDLGGIAKGYILQDALGVLRNRGVTRALVESGGDIVAGEPPPDRSGWLVEAAGADEKFQARASRLTNAALATSGASAQFVEIEGVRYSHVIDPRTGRGLMNGLTARVIAPDGATADALATALTVLGRTRADRLLEQFPDVLACVSQ